MCTSIFKYFNYLYKNFTRIPIIKEPKQENYFKLLIRKISHRLLYTRSLKESTVLEEVLSILYNGYNETNSILRKAFIKNLFSILLEEQDMAKFDEIIKTTPTVLMLKEMGYHFLEKEIDAFIYNFLILEDELKQLENEKDCKKLQKRLFKSFIQDILDCVFFPQLFLDILLVFETDEASGSLHDWETIIILDKYQFKIKSKRLLKNTLESFVAVASADLIEQNGFVKFPSEFYGNHSIRVRERNNHIRVSLINWLECLITYYTSDDVKIINASRKMLLFIFNYIECNQTYIHLNILNLLYNSLSKFSFNQLPEIGGGLNISSESNSSRFLTRLHTSSNGKISNYFIWIRIYEKIIDENYRAKLANTVSLIRSKQLHEVYLQALIKIPTIIKKHYTPVLDDHDFKIKQYLQENDFKFNNQFLADVFENRRIYKIHQQRIDGFMIKWNTEQRSKKLLLLRYITHSFGLIFYSPQTGLTKQMTKDDFVQEFPFFQKNLKSVKCHESLLINFLSNKDSEHD